MNPIVLYHIWQKVWDDQITSYSLLKTTTEQDEVFEICKAGTEFFYTYETAYQREV